MKRSEINGIIKEAEAFFARHQFFLPKWCHWDIGEWKRHRYDCREIRTANLGWDITDFGSGDFRRRGLLLITLRNGPGSGIGKPYAEKIMIVREAQETPLHFHWRKQEDIINRGGGKLAFELFLSTEDGQCTEEPFTIQKDGITVPVEPGAPLVLDPGESLTLDRSVYHRFYALPGEGAVLCGEVSEVNDDKQDNRFHETLGRFPAIDEDEPPYRLLVNDYETFLEKE